ncbi:MAG: hypothetical protein DWQ07_25260 [Chloroflexi bacterium]|nr:MAG: hypothetical protein DWQ07_25260 [Chloroflexota bacterium]MBL1196155.1 hypothetical protein [Chloroflexota bacterium]NOH13448.1 hypothetical protein [Chloroflexota bacterium]
MPTDEENLFSESGLELTKAEQQIIRVSETGTTSDISKTRTISSIYQAKLMEKALLAHAAALNRAAAASDKYARSLTWATWALVAATVGLIVVALIGPSA